MRPPAPKRSRAVLIGTGKYAHEKLPDLPVVGKTISDLATVFTDPFHGVVAKDRCVVLEDKGDIRLIGHHLRSAAQEAEDLLLVYFVGHGLVGSRRHELYLGLADSEWEHPEFNSLEYDKLRSAVLDSAATTKIIILDCCFSGRAVNEAMTDPVTEMVGQIGVDGTYVLASADRDQVALILPGEGHTAFSGRLLHLLRNGVPGGPELLTVDYLYQQLVTRMRVEGLSQPQKRATSTADLFVLGLNRAFATSMIPPTRAIFGNPMSTDPSDPPVVIGDAFVQKCVKGINGITLDDAKEIAQIRGLTCAWLQTASQISPAEIAERLTSEELDLHINYPDEEHPTRGGLVRDQTPFISLAAGSVERDVFQQTNSINSALRVAINHSTEFGRLQGEFFLFYCWVLVGITPSVHVRSLAEDVRELNTYSRYSPFQPEGAIVAKIDLPASQIERFEHYECLADRDGRPRVTRLGTYKNPNYVWPHGRLNYRDLI